MLICILTSYPEIVAANSEIAELIIRIVKNTEEVKTENLQMEEEMQEYGI